MCKILLWGWVVFLAVPFQAGLAHAMYFNGGAGDGYSSVLGYSRSWGFLGGAGRGEAMILTASQTLMSFYSTAQAFMLGDASTTAGALVITQDTAVGGSGVTAAGDIRVTIPSSLGMIWDNTAAPTITGGASGKVAATVTYADDRTMVVDVTSDFIDADAITVSNLAFKSFTYVGYANLLLDITNGTGAKEPDLYEKLINAAERSAGFLGGFGRGEAVISIYQHPQNTIDFGTLF